MSKPLLRSSSRIAVVVFVALATLACGGPEAVLTADPTGTAVFDQGQDALIEEDWAAAIVGFDTLLKNYPSSPYLAEARLGLGRAYYEQGRVDSLIMAIDSFQAFLTYHPSHEHVDTAQYMLAMTYVKQMRTPDRDQQPTRQAIEELDRFIETYPDSPLYKLVVQERLAAIDQLTAHELQVAGWQAGRDEDWDAAVDRVNWALERYPETTLKCELFFILGEAYKKGNQLQDAVRYYDQVVSEYPDCEYADDASDRIKDINGG